MNGLTLRISNGSGKKTKNSLSLTPIRINGYISQSVCEKNILINDFLEADTTDKQLEILKCILEENRQMCNDNDVIFLVVVFFHSEAKHPIKSFLARYITKNTSLQKPFSIALAKEMSTSIRKEHIDYKDYIDVVSKLATCLENFPTAATAIRILENDVADYLTICLKHCVETIGVNKTLSPTEKNEIYNLSHLALRLLMYLVQKNYSENSNLSSVFPEVRLILKHLMFDEDVPMDTKSVCGILYLSMHVMEHGQGSWVDVFLGKEGNLSNFLDNEASQLSLYSAITTVVSIEDLQNTDIDGKSAVSELTTRIIRIGEKSSSESIFVLGVARTILQISKALAKITHNSVGLEVVDNLLTFIWGHLEHYMDSVRHLTAQSLANVVRYCTALKKYGNEMALNNLFTALTSLDKTRKSYYVSLTSLTNELGAAAILERMPTLISEVTNALSIQAVQASATTTLEVLLQKHVRVSSTEIIYQSWIETIMRYVENNILETGVLNVIEVLLTKAVKLDEQLIEYIIPYIKKSCEPGQSRDMRCILMLLNVARKSGMADKLASQYNQTEWKGIIEYDVLKMAAVDAVDETRILSLSLIVESPKSTEIFPKGDLDFVLHYLKYNINSQSPNFRQLTLSMMKKFILRFDDSYKVLKKQKEDHYYLVFIEELRALCFESLIPGTNYSRRFIALQVLLWCEKLYLEGYKKKWKYDYVEKLLLHLEDSYEKNKSFALEILDGCPIELIKNNKYSISLELQNVLKQASSLKPTDCISAAYKLNLLKNKLPEFITQDYSCEPPEPVSYALLKLLQDCLCEELSVCQNSIVNGATRAPMYGILHCMVHLIGKVDVCAISSDDRWSSLVRDVIATCMAVNAAVAAVVNNSSPEGHLPMDMSGIVVTDHGNSGGVRLEDGRQVTAQMVLLCAWRSVKEVSLLLGEISSRLSIVEEESSRGTLTHDQLICIGKHFTKLLAETKHRGAFEQAYVGFTKLLARLWRCRSPSLHELPRTWLCDLMAAIESGDKNGTLCATRRSAGLPFMIQALVTTELQVHGNPKCFHQCIGTLLRLARSRTDPASATETAVEMRTHSINILRALFRNSALDESVATYTGEGLVVALEGFAGGTWMERNSSTLLFSALMVRIFGVQRSRDTENLCVRNRMTGRIFFLRYPMMYDFMLAKLKEVSESEDTQVLRPSLYPILLLLARLYPSSLEGTVSNLKLVAYIPHVLSCAKSGVLKTRQLAAKAMVPLISPEQYLLHLEAMLTLICDQKIMINYCHGILLQLVRLFDARPENLIIEKDIHDRLQDKIKLSMWILEQALTDMPCYLLADEYVKVVNNIIVRFPSLIDEQMATRLDTFIDKLLFNRNVPMIKSGRDICLANAFYLHLIILSKFSTVKNVTELVLKSLTYDSYEVVLAVLNYLLILQEKMTTENKLQETLLLILDKNVLLQLRQSQTYIPLLCEVLIKNKYIECSQKALKVLTLERDTEKYIVEMKNGKCSNLNDDFILNTLIDCVQNGQENLTHIYLESLSNFVSKKLEECCISGTELLYVIRTIFACSSSDNSDDTRNVVVEFIDKNIEKLLISDLEGLSEEDKFEYKATVYATIVRVLEDDDASLRQRTSDAVIRLYQATCKTATAEFAAYKVISSKAAEILREIIANDKDSITVYVVLALLDFKSEVCVTDEVSDESRVFDHNEKYNIFLEETIWTNHCADIIIQQCSNSNIKPMDQVCSLVNTPVYMQTFQKLCANNLSAFQSCHNTDIPNKIVLNPKIELFNQHLLLI